LATGSHAPAWELILGCNTIDKVCIPTREREWMDQASSFQMKRPVRSRMQGVVGAGVRYLRLPDYVLSALSGKRSGCSIISSVRSTSIVGQ
jgi:hypothetical protein